MRRRKWGLAAMMLVAACGKQESCCGDPLVAETALPGASIYHLESSWRNALGRDMQLSSLRGKPTVVALFFTHCAYACPRITADLQALARRLEPSSTARIAMFSMDPGRDTPARLAEFAAERGLDPNRFELYTASEAAVRELAAVLGLRYKQLDSGDFAHSNGYLVLNADGVVTARVDGLGSDPTAALRALERGKP